MADGIVQHRACVHCGSQFAVPTKNPPDTTKHCSVECRFWSKVDKSQGDAACWTFIGAHTSGYGSFRFNGRSRRAHRIAWELTCGPIPVGMFACHRCDNRECCNPAHLFLGTAADNVHDMHSKGRSGMSEEARARLSTERKGKRLPQHVLEAAWSASRGRRHTPEEIAQRAASNTGQKRSEETKAKLRAAWARRRISASNNNDGV